MGAGPGPSREQGVRQRYRSLGTETGSWAQAWRVHVFLDGQIKCAHSPDARRLVRPGRVAEARGGAQEPAPRSPGCRSGQGGGGSLHAAARRRRELVTVPSAAREAGQHGGSARPLHRGEGSALSREPRSKPCFGKEAGRDRNCCVSSWSSRA